MVGYWSRKGFHAVNAQAVCDSNCKFAFASCRCAGSAHGSTAWPVAELCKAIKEGRLPDLVWIAADDAFERSNQALAPWPGKVELLKDSCNCHLPPLRARIEQAFGMLVKRWGILRKPFMASLEPSRKFFLACAKLRSFFIDEREV